MHSRFLNAKRNIIVALINNFIMIILPFINRTVVLWILGAEFQGLGSLFGSILQVLNLAELGFSTAIVCNMYKPIAEHDEYTVCALLNFYKKIYRCIGFIVLIVGLIIIPLLPYLTKGDYPKEINIYVLYLIYLSNSVVSYFLFAYKGTLLIANERSDINNGVLSITNFLRYILQFLVLIITKNYYLFILVQLITTILNNVITALIAKKLYPQYYCKGILSKDIKHDIKKKVSD